MNRTLGRVGVAAILCFGLAGAASALDGDHGFQGQPFGKSAGKSTGKGAGKRAGKMAMPHYAADTRVSGPQQPYDWPVADRYRPVSKPFYGRAY